MDETDEKIIEAMKKKSLCTPKISEIAKILDMPASTVHSRIKQMEKKKIIKNYVPVIDMEKTGPYIESFILVRGLIGTDLTKLIERFYKNPIVKEISLLTGEWYLILRIRVKNFDEYNEEIKKLFTDVSVSYVVDMISTKNFKREF